MSQTNEAECAHSPVEIKNSIWVFPPNSSCKGGTSWWIGCSPEPVLIDCPPLTQETIESLKLLSAGKASRIILTSRESHGRVRELQSTFGWKVMVQEQEAYLLPEISALETFSEEHTTISGLRILWTPGPTPGSSVIYAPPPWNVLFCGRLLIPLKFDRISSFRSQLTFHWSRQKESLDKLRKWLPPDARPELASGVGLERLGKNKLVSWECWNETS